MEQSNSTSSSGIAPRNGTRSASTNGAELTLKEKVVYYLEKQNELFEKGNATIEDIPTLLTQMKLEDPQLADIIGSIEKSVKAEIRCKIATDDDVHVDVCSMMPDSN